MQDKFKQLRTYLGEVMDLAATAELLGWDQQTYMPPGSNEGRSMQLATLSRLTHEKFTSDELGSALEDLKSIVEELDPNSDDARLIAQVSKEFDKQRKVPNEYVAEFARITALTHQTWEKARQESDFSIFRADLEKIIAMRQEYANFFQPYDHIYDPLLDDFEAGMKTADVKKVFADLRPRQVALVNAIAESSYQVDDSVLHQEFDESTQWAFGEEVIKAFGYDFNRGRQDKSVHPFTSSFGNDDVRITTRVAPNYFNTALFGTLHEAGHGMYEQGIGKQLARTPISHGASFGFHESQSRMWENLVGRGKPFWIAFFPRLQEYFPEALRDVNLDDFYRAINKVERSLIRVEADETTYNLHIMVRFELEIALMTGELSAVNLPEAWNQKYEDYLGITPPDDAQGVLQDIHWSFGGFGYFSTYSLGNLISSMLWEVIQRDLPDLQSQFEKAEFGGLLEWLRANIYVHGAKYEPMELLKMVTGSALDADPYMRYLEAKFGEIYKL